MNDSDIRTIIDCINAEIRRTISDSENIDREQRHRRIAVKRKIVNESYIRGLSKAKIILIDLTGYEPEINRRDRE